MLKDDTESKYNTSREERLKTGMDLTGKCLLANKSDILEMFLFFYTPIMCDGAIKYLPSNWETSPFDFKTSLDSCRRHIENIVIINELLDKQSGFYHIGHILARIAFAITKLSRMNGGNEIFCGWNYENILKMEECIDRNYGKIGWRKSVYGDAHPDNTFKFLACSHTTCEQIRAISENKLWSYKDTFEYQDWIKQLYNGVILCLLDETETDLTSLYLLFDIALNVAYHTRQQIKPLNQG